MRETEASGWMVQNTLGRDARAAARRACPGRRSGDDGRRRARAGDDDEDDDQTFEEKIIDNIMTGIGGTNMENTRASNTASVRRWWCRPRSICRRRLPPRPK